MLVCKRRRKRKGNAHAQKFVTSRRSAVSRQGWGRQRSGGSARIPTSSEALPTVALGRRRDSSEGVARRGWAIAYSQWQGQQPSAIHRWLCPLPPSARSFPLSSRPQSPHRTFHANSFAVASPTAKLPRHGRAAGALGAGNAGVWCDTRRDALEHWETRLVRQTYLPPG